MREIKFRAKRIDNGRWVYGQYFKTPLTDENSGTLPESGWFFLCGEPRHCIVQDMVSFVIDVETLGQYTGLKDKDGIPIFEGDILQDSNGKRYQIKWGINSNGFIAQTNETHGNVYSSYHLAPKTEIIGNVYEK